MQDRTPLVDVQPAPPFFEYFILFLTCYFSMIFSANTVDIQENLILAARNGNLESVRELVCRGALANCHDGEALICAAANGHLEVVRFLSRGNSCSG